MARVAPAAHQEPAPRPAPAEPLDGQAVRALLAAGTAWLERNAGAVNALNVFPVPDGDTGTNMLLTMRAAVDAAGKLKAGDLASAGHVMRAAAQGAVMGARGNSGVILSQIFAGMARALDDSPVCDAPLLARALVEGANSAYRAVTKPVEGTILTVARAAGAGAEHALRTAAPAPTCRCILEQALAAAQEAVERTPEQLAILRQAGVVDAGGEGYRVVLEGMVFALRGEPLPEAAPAEPAAAPATGVPALRGADLSAVPVEEWGYCTQFVICGQGLDVSRIREELQQLAASALVVGDDTVVRVHGHTEDPGQLLTHAARHGRLQRVSIEDMDAQHDAWLRTQVAGVAAGEEARQAPGAGAVVVAVAPGEGLAEVFRSLGVAAVVPGGQTMNPSTRDLLDIARSTGAGTAILLPNNSRVIWAAEQAVGLGANEGLRLLVVPTRTVPQGIAAVLAFNPEAPPEQNVAAMQEAAGTVRSVEVTRATRSVTIGSVAIKEGDVVALLDDELVAAGCDVLEVARRALDQAGAAQAEMLTVYYGAEVGDDDAQRFAETLRAAYPKAELEVAPGGQPHYDYIISVE
jgi:DAK2 domain fusion protein YloV